LILSMIRINKHCIIVEQRELVIMVLLENDSKNSLYGCKALTMIKYAVR
jgi:hypothetical protein